VSFPCQLPERTVPAFVSPKIRLPMRLIGPATADRTGPRNGNSRLNWRASIIACVIAALGAAYARRRTAADGPVQAAVSVSRTGAVRGGGSDQAHGKRIFGDTNAGTVRSGNWHGNDTTWRMCHDLNRILMYADAEGRVHDQPVRRFFSVVDGIVAGEGNGPLDPTPKRVASCSRAAIQWRWMRFVRGSWVRCRPVAGRAAGVWPVGVARSWDLRADDVVVRSNQVQYAARANSIATGGPAFQPHFGWKGYVEIERRRWRRRVLGYRHEAANSVMVVRAVATRAALMALYAMCIVAYYAAVPGVGCLDVRGATMFANRDRDVLATFYTKNWCISHLTPLARAANVSRVIAIVDGPTQPINGVTYVAPPRWMVRVLGRAISKFLWGMATAVRTRRIL